MAKISRLLLPATIMSGFMIGWWQVTIIGLGMVESIPVSFLSLVLAGFAFLLGRSSSHTEF